MDEGLKNRVIKILEDEQNQLDGVYDPQSDVSAPSKVTNVLLLQMMMELGIKLKKKKIVVFMMNL